MSDDVSKATSNDTNKDAAEETTGRWWFCLKHQRVEPDAGCPNKDRMGPYATRAAAAAALQVAGERNEAWEKADEEWNDD